MNHLTKLLQEIEDGNETSREDFWKLVYPKLRQIARGLMLGERSDHTLQSTALVNEAWVKLGGEDQIHWKNRRHFFGAAAKAMRQIVMDHARGKNARKRDFGRRVQMWDDLPPLILMERDPALALDLDKALDELATIKPTHAKIVELRFFAGRKWTEIAKILGVSLATVRRYWEYSCSFLQIQLEDEIRKKL